MEASENSIVKDIHFRKLNNSDVDSIDFRNIEEYAFQFWKARKEV